MATSVEEQSRRGRRDGETGRARMPRHAAIGRLMAECGALLSVANRLECVAADLHKTNRADDARLLADRLQHGLGEHLDTESAMLDTIDTRRDKTLRDAVARTRDEHLALRDLVEPVIGDLRDVVRTGLPAHPNRFVIEATVVAEFIRLHVKYKCETVYPLIGSVDGREPAPAGSA